MKGFTSLILGALFVMPVSGFASLDAILAPVKLPVAEASASTSIESAIHSVSGQSSTADAVDNTSDSVKANAAPKTSEPKPVTVSEDELVSLLQTRLSKKLELTGKLRLNSVSRLPSVKAVPGTLSVKLVDFPDHLTSSGVLLRFKLSSDGNDLGQWTAAFHCQYFADVLIPNRRISPDDDFSESDFSIRKIDVIRSSDVVPVNTDLSKYQLNRMIYPDRPLTWSDLEQRALVHQGDIVDVVAQDGLLSISMKGLATRSGVRGDVIPVRNLQSKKDFPAEVIDEKKVQVTF